MTCVIFLVIFSKKNHGLIEEDNPSEQVVIVEEELNRVDIDEIGKLVDLPRFVFIDEACWNLKVVNDVGELTRNINWKKKSDVSQWPVHVHSVTNLDESMQYCQSVR